MALIDLVIPEIVKVPLESKDKPDVLRELVQVLKDAGQIEDSDTVLKAVQEREDKQSTGLEAGIAVPHCKSAAVSSLKLAVGIAPDGIDFDSVDGKPEALAEIAKLARSNAFCHALASADSAQTVVELMKGE
jgi:mannitol/fructose-specific phosphotransferase system IIA component (Ntr-type)